MFDHTKSREEIDFYELFDNRSTSQQSYLPSERVFNSSKSFISSKDTSRDDKYALAITSGDQLQYSKTSKVSHHVRSFT